MDRLKDKIAVITGAAKGIGYETVRTFINEGAQVVMTDLDVEAGSTASAHFGTSCNFIAQDVTDESSWDKLANHIETTYGRLDVLVNNAGILATETTQDIETTTLAQWRAVQQVNVEGVFMGCQMAVRIMKKTGGSIVNISSTAGIVGEPRLVAYCASKGAVRLMTKGVALHCARNRYKIRCNSVHPGPIETDMGDALLGLQNYIDGPNLESKWETLRRRIPTGSSGEAPDVAACILFLASDDSKHMTGSELVVDGGMTAN